MKNVLYGLLSVALLMSCSAPTSKSINITTSTDRSGEFLDFLNKDELFVVIKQENNTLSIVEVNLVFPVETNLEEPYKENKAKGVFLSCLKIFKNRKYSECSLSIPYSHIFYEGKFDASQLIGGTIGGVLYAPFAAVNLLAGKSEQVKNEYGNAYTHHAINQQELSRIGQFIDSKLSTELLAATNTLPSLYSFIDKYNAPSLLEAHPVVVLIAKKERENILNSNSVEKLSTFLDAHTRDQEVRQKLVSLYKQGTTIDVVKNYLKKYPTDKEVIEILAGLYTKNGSFDGFMQAYQLTRDTSYIDSAIELTKNSNPPSSLISATDSSLKIFFDATVKSLANIPQFYNVMSSLGKDPAQFRNKIIKLPKFGKNLDEHNFIESIEYKYIFKNQKPNIEAIYNGSSYGLEISYPDKTFVITRTAFCQYARQYSEIQDLGFWEDLGNAVSGGTVKDKLVYYDVYRCSAPAKNLRKMAKLEKLLTLKTQQTTLIKRKAGWEDFRYANSSYNKFQGSNGGVKYINWSDDSKSWGVRCNNGAFGTVMIDDSSYCASGANKKAKCKFQGGSSWGSEYLCR